jgi:hypothetical protein
MVRLVFRPYTQVRRTICTSVSLRASTRVSSGFASLRHSSPSFGSRRACSNSNPSQKLGVGQRCGSRVGLPARQLPCAYRVLEPVDSHACQTPWSVFQDGSGGEPASRRLRSCPVGTPRRRAVRPVRPRPREGLRPPDGPTTVHATSRAADRHTPFRIRPTRVAGPHPLPSRQFQALFDSLFKVLFIFPSRYLSAIGLSPVFSLGRSLPPDLGCIPKQPDSPTAPLGATGSEPNGALTLPGTPFQGTCAQSAAEDASPDYNSGGAAAGFSSWAAPGSLAVTRGILVSFSSSAYLYA